MEDHKVNNLENATQKWKMFLMFGWLLMTIGFWASMAPGATTKKIKKNKEKTSVKYIARSAT